MTNQIDRSMTLRELPDKITRLVIFYILNKICYKEQTATNVFLKYYLEMTQNVQKHKINENATRVFEYLKKNQVNQNHHLFIWR